MHFTRVIHKILIISVFGFVADCFMAAERRINNMMFSTMDKDNDIIYFECANRFRAGWWYSYCHCANPNGEYLAGHNTQSGVGITYGAWHGLNYSLKFTQLMVKPNYYPTHVTETMEIESAPLPNY